MFDWLTRLFGEGKIRIEGTTDDGREFTAKINYIGSLDTVMPEEVIAKCKREMYVEHGAHVVSARIVGYTY